MSYKVGDGGARHQRKFWVRSEGSIDTGILQKKLALALPSPIELPLGRLMLSLCLWETDGMKL